MSDAGGATDHAPRLAPLQSGQPTSDGTEMPKELLIADWRGCDSGEPREEAREKGARDRSPDSPPSAGLDHACDEPNLCNDDPTAPSPAAGCIHAASPLLPPPPP